jgi:hypothetical protein
VREQPDMDGEGSKYRWHYLGKVESDTGGIDG